MGICSSDINEKNNEPEIKESIEEPEEESIGESIGESGEESIKKLRENLKYIEKKIRDEIMEAKNSQEPVETCNIYRKESKNFYQEYIKKLHIRGSMLGDIWLVEGTITKKEYVLKESIAMVRRESAEDPVNELMVLRQLRLLDQNHAGYNFIAHIVEGWHDQHSVNIILSYTEYGDLCDYVIRHKILNIEMSRLFFSQISKGLLFIHSNNLCHRDMSLENCLIFREDDNYTIKITDFGQARMNKIFENSINRRVGKPGYIAPEFFVDNVYDGKCIDIWAMGCIFFTLLSGFKPFGEDSLTKYSEKYLYFKQNGILRLIREYDIAHLFDYASLDLIYRMLRIDPRKRISISDVVKHKWLEIPNKKIE